LTKGLQHIIDTLGFKDVGSLYFLNQTLWKRDCKFSNRVTLLLERKIKPDAFFVFGNKPLILFYENPSDKLTIHKAVWNFNESPIVFIVEDDNLEIFNGFHFLKDDNSLERIGSYEKLDDFNYFKLVTGSTWEDYQSALDKENRVDYLLLKNIKNARELLKDIIKDDSFRIVNALIGKIIFIRYLIDRKVKIGFNEESRYWEKDDLIKVLSKRELAIDFFKHLQLKFNGDMFPLEDSDYDLITQECLNIIIRLLNEEDLGDGQLSLFNLYDFSIIPIEFVSNVYESFIGEKNQEKEGAYYTPLFLVDYILSETVEKHFENRYVYNCRVLDPACGSGIFLVETLRKIIERFIEIHPIIANNPTLFKKALPTLAKNNIFGVDKNLAAIQVAIFSIQLTLLDYQEPSDIETFRCPPLLNTNFFESDFFETDQEKPLNKVVGKLDIRFILGNPPWKRGKGDEEKPLFDEYIKQRKKKEKKLQKEGPEITISNKEIAQAFLLRVSDFSNENTECGLIATSKVLYNLQGKNFRAYFLHNFKINKVFELAPVRHEVFNQSNNDTAVGPAAILFYKDAQGVSTDLNVVDHVTLKPSRFFSSFKVFSLTRNDFKKVEQKKLKDYDWLWKTLVYGSYLDFSLIKRLKENYSSIEKELQDTSRFIKGQGIMVGGGDPNDASHLIGLPYIDTRRDIKPFWINKKTKSKWEFSVVHRPRESVLFKAPMLLITEGITTEFKSVSCVCDFDATYRSSLTAIKALNPVDIDCLRTFSAILNSNFFSYYALQTFSCVGIEREQSHDEEKWSLPFIANEIIPAAVFKIEELLTGYYHDKQLFFDTNLEKSISKEKELLEQVITNVFNFSFEEKSILDYSIEIIIPLEKKHLGYDLLFKELSFNDSYLSSYAQVFLDRFTPTLNKNGKKFIVEIWHSHHIIGMMFKVVPDDADHNDNIVWFDKGNDLIMQKMISLGANKITDRLFVQKDIRGFEKNFFYVFKPNEKRLWHKAIAYLDADEFMDAILRAGRRGE
jgi:hypothetical protein